MKKEDFSPHTRYTVTLEVDGRLRPANLYVYRTYDNFMIARLTQQGGELRKIPYDRVAKIVKTIPVPPEDQFFIPEAVLKEKVWATRDVMMRYSTSPHMGK